MSAVIDFGPHLIGTRIDAIADDFMIAVAKTGTLFGSGQAGGELSNQDAPKDAASTGRSG